MDDFECPIKIESIERWISSEDEENCRSCLLGTLSSWYISILNETGNNALAGQVDKAFETEDPLTIAQELDKIKRQVGESVKSKLEEFDCLAQTYKQEDSV